MNIEKISSSYDWIGLQYRTRTHTILKDELGNSYNEITVQVYTPYSSKGQLVTTIEKGNSIDEKV